MSSLPIQTIHSDTKFRRFDSKSTSGFKIDLPQHEIYQIIVFVISMMLVFRERFILSKKMLMLDYIFD